MEVYSKNGLVEIITNKDRSPKGETLYTLCRNLANKIDKVIVSAAKDTNIPLNSILPLQFSFEFLHKKMRFNLNFKFQGNAVYKQFIGFDKAIAFMGENSQDPKIEEPRLIDYISNSLQYISRKDSSVEDNIRYKEFTKGLLRGNFQVNFRNLKKDLELINNLAGMVCQSLEEIDTDEVVEKEIKQDAPCFPISGFKYSPYKCYSNINTKFEYFANLKAPLNDRNDINQGWVRLLKENLEKSSILINKLMNSTAKEKVLFGLGCTVDLVGKASLHLYIPTLDKSVKEFPSDRIIKSVKIDENSDYVQTLASLLKMETKEFLKDVKDFSSFNILLDIILKPYSFFNINKRLSTDKKFYDSPYADLKNQFELAFKSSAQMHEEKLNITTGLLSKDLHFKTSIRTDKLPVGKYRLHSMIEINNLQFSLGFDFSSERHHISDIIDESRISSILECIRGFLAITLRIERLKDVKKFKPKMRVYFNNTKDISKQDNIIIYIGSDSIKSFTIRTINVLDNSVKEPKIGLNQIDTAFEVFMAAVLMDDELRNSLIESDFAEYLNSYILENEDAIKTELQKVYDSTVKMDVESTKGYILDSLSNRLHGICVSKIDFYRNKAVLK
jgi:predicted house-cleaning noncanonical NTP pyrophosphatase (MazG superfamily)